MENKDRKSSAGRKPISDKKIPLTIYIEESVIISLGGGWLITGKDVARSVAVNAVYESNKINKSV